MLAPLAVLKESGWLRTGFNCLFITIVSSPSSISVRPFLWVSECWRLKSTSVSVCFRGISRLPSAFVFLRWFKLAHISIQVCTFHDGCKQRIDQQIFNRKSISRKITHPQSWKLQAKLTGEKLKGWSNSREKTNSRLQSNKSKSTFFLLLDGSKIFSLLPTYEKSKLFSGFSTFQTFQESMARRDSLSLSATLKSTSVSVCFRGISRLPSAFGTFDILPYFIWVYLISDINSGTKHFLNKAAMMFFFFHFWKWAKALIQKNWI